METDMEKLLERFIAETDRRFAQVSDQLTEVHSDLKDLTKFKVEMLVSARWTSLVVSGILGFVTMAVTTYVNVRIAEAAKASIPMKATEK